MPQEFPELILDACCVFVMCMLCTLWLAFAWVGEILHIIEDADAVVRALFSTNVTRVQFPDPPSYVTGGVCVFFTLLLDFFPSGSPVFPSHEKPTFDLICWDLFQSTWLEQHFLS